MTIPVPRHDAREPRSMQPKKGKPDSRRFIFAVDFDGTLCAHKFPAIGEPNEDLIAILKRLKQHGNRLILWTCRHGQHLEDALAWCRERELFFDAVNEDIDEVKDSEFGRTKSNKVFAHIYIDDRASNPAQIDEAITSIMREALSR